MFPTFAIALTIFAMVTGTNSLPVVTPQPTVLSVREFSMTDRYANQFVSDVFRDNILLTIAYMAGKVKPNIVDWTTVEKPFTYTLTLKKGETFAFHDTVLPEYKGKVTYTTNAHFNSSEGFKSDGYLVADGVCHLASLLSWAAKDAGLTVKAPTNHDFAVIPEVPKSEGVAIYDSPTSPQSSELQNLYITNNFDTDVAIVFAYDGKELKISIEK